jgi:CheY-like chemotaxis protein
VYQRIYISSYFSPTYDVPWLHTKMNRRILVIDDDEGLREIIRFSLEVVSEWQVLMAASGQEGLHLAVSEQPDAILLDVVMPGSGGLEILTQLQQRMETRSIPVIMLTAKANGERRQLLEQGAKGVIIKPFKPQALVSEICALLNW